MSHVLLELQDESQETQKYLVVFLGLLVAGGFCLVVSWSPGDPPLPLRDTVRYWVSPGLILSSGDHETQGDHKTTFVFAFFLIFVCPRAKPGIYF